MKLDVYSLQYLLYKGLLMTSATSWRFRFMWQHMAAAILVVPPWRLWWLFPHVQPIDPKHQPLYPKPNTFINLK